MMPNTWHGIVQKKYEEVNLNNVYEWTRMSEMRNEKKYTHKILYARNMIARYDTQIICVIFVRGCGYTPRLGQRIKTSHKKQSLESKE